MVTLTPKVIAATIARVTTTDGNYMTKPLWVTYAWADNKDGNFDHIINALNAAGIETHFDRIALISLVSVSGSR